MKRLSNFLDIFTNCSGLWCTVWVLGEEDDGPLWEGSLRDIPYWIAILELPTKEEVHEQDWDEVIDFRHGGEGKNKNKPGLVIVVKDS